MHQQTRRDLMVRDHYLFAENGSSQHHTRHFTKSVKADGKHSREDHSTARESAGGCEREIDECSADNNGEKLNPP